MERLISMVAFVLEQIKVKKNKIEESEKNKTGYQYVIDAESYFNYVVESFANFLSQKLELWMFVPSKLVEGAWVVLEECIYKDGVHIYLNFDEKQDYLKRCKEFQEAKNRCLFEGFEVGVPNNPVTNLYPKTINNGKLHVYWYRTDIKEWVKPTKPTSDLNTIESLTKYNLKLTASAKKTLSI